MLDNVFGNVNLLNFGTILIVTGILILILPQKFQRPLMLIGPIVLSVSFLVDGNNVLGSAADADVRLKYMFCIIFIFASIIGALYALNLASRFEAAAEAVYAGSSIGAVLSDRWIEMIIFWELMAIASWLIIVSRRTKSSSKAAFRYLLVHMLGGNLLLAGAALKLAAGSYEITCLTGSEDLAFWLIFTGVAVNAAIPPLHSWIADAYPEASISGTVYMASFTTKVGALYMIRLFAGNELLLWLGVFMALFGASMALIENNMRRLLSYHIVSQLGFIIAAAGVGGAIGIDGAAAHAFNNILYKGVLLMACGSVIYATGKEKISELGGLWRKMPFTCACFLIASLSIAGVPLFNGFVSKSLVMNSMAENGFHAAELLLMIAGVGSLLSITLKFNYFVFFGKTASCAGDNLCVTGDGIKERVIPINMKLAMLIGASVCVIIGVFPNLLYGITPFGSDGHPFTVDHVTQYVQLLASGSLAFLMYIDHMAPKEKITLDVDWFFRKPLKSVYHILMNTFTAVTEYVKSVCRKPIKFAELKVRISEKMPVKMKRRGGLESEDVLKKPIGLLLLVNVVAGLAIAAAAIFALRS